MRLTEIAGVILAALPIFAQNPPTPTASGAVDRPRLLTSSNRIKFEIPKFGFTGKSACDSSGNITFNVGRKIGQMGPFLRVQSDGRSHVIYSLPAEATSWGNIAWAMTPGGTFYVLHEDFKEYKLVRFKIDGSVAGITTLDVPKGVDVLYFAIADNEQLFARGYLVSSEPLKHSRSGFAALFNASGKLVRDLSAGAPMADLSTAQTSPIGGDAIAGEDGRFYVLEERQVLVLNQSGEIEDTLKFDKPTPDAHPVRIDYSKGLVSILFHSIQRVKATQPALVEVRAILLNAQTGEQQGDFVFDPGSTENIICFNRQEGYSLMAIDDKMAAKDIFPIR
jgi:hypothetical protein